MFNDNCSSLNIQAFTIIILFSHDISEADTSTITRFTIQIAGDVISYESKDIEFDSMDNKYRILIRYARKGASQDDPR